MPLLKKKPFEKIPIPENLRDEEEVFYCNITNELFRDYEDFSERMFLCNSMIWTCSMTGKANLTYPEALESEASARKSLKEFPAELKIPILYLAGKTKRTAFSDMVEDVFLYAKDRYFIWENVETCFTGGKWKDSHILQVIAPPADEMKNQDASSYKYEIEHLNVEDTDISEIMIVDCNQIRRKKGSFSRDKCKLFLKQCMEQDDRGIFIVRSSVVKKFQLDKVVFGEIFGGPMPEFDASKKFPNGKKVRQESLHKFLSKNDSFTKNGNDAFIEKIRKKEEAFRLMQQQKKEKEIESKVKKQEEKLFLARCLNNWNQPKEDLELVDHQKLPILHEVKLKVPDECLGDMFMIMEFVNDFSKILSAKDFFPGGLTVEVMERALTENEVAGPLIDLIQMFLVALFNLQNQEASQYNTDLPGLSNFKTEEISSKNSLQEASRYATIAATWTRRFQGLSIGDLPLYSLTTSEVLRLHFLSSGAMINHTGAWWRSQQRGGYVSEDDPGLHLRFYRPHILQALKTHNVVELSTNDKLEILSCLINQLLTYSDVRDIVEERVENMRQAKLDYKVLLNSQKRREKKILAARYKSKKMIKTDSRFLDELQKLESEAEKRKSEYEEEIEVLKKTSYEKQIFLGQDRCFRKYFKLESVPGFFVNSEEENPGTCFNCVVEQIPHLVNANSDDTLEYIKKSIQDSGSSDKENSPSKSSKKCNGFVNGFSDQKTVNYNDLMLCSADPTNCIVHSSNRKQWKWFFFNEKSTFHQLIDSLNKRGLRENELQRNLKNNKTEIEKLVLASPVHCLNMNLKNVQEEIPLKKKGNKQNYDNANLGYPNYMNPSDILANALMENILEMEEKIFGGNLGILPVNDRDKWRYCIQNRKFQDLDKTLVKEDDKDTEEIDSEMLPHLSDNKDATQILDAGLDFVSDIDNSVTLEQTEEIQQAIRSLSVALAQVARSVGTKFLKKPLGHMNGDRKVKTVNMLHRWERSVLSCTSFSQLFLHYSTLDSCIMWGKSVLLARCKVCRRRHDPENMIFCINCNLRYHLYCLKPKLKSTPIGNWFCKKCQKDENIPIVSKPPRRRRKIFLDDGDDADFEDVQTTEGSGSDDTVNSELEENSDVNVHVCKTCGSGGDLMSCEKCNRHYHIECVEPPLRRVPRGSWFCTRCKRINDRKRHHDSSDDEVFSKRASRRSDGRTDLPLHNSALHAVLSEIMKDSNAWPFLRPVQKNEVPDYYDVITKPMDFGTIKYKLNMGEYREDAQFMSDSLLVFQNCTIYNRTEDDVYKCGVALLKLFQSKCKDLGLKLPEELDCEPNSRRKLRTKV